MPKSISMLLRKHNINPHNDISYDDVVNAMEEYKISCQEDKLTTVRSMSTSTCKNCGFRPARPGSKFCDNC